MDAVDIECRCYIKLTELLNKYFSSIVNDACEVKPDSVASQYTIDLPEKIGSEFKDYLESLWKEIAPNDERGIDDILNHPQELDRVRNQYCDLPKVYQDAEKVTIWERLTKSNHEDVTFFKGLLKSYSEELMKCMIFDFREEVKQIF